LSYADYASLYRRSIEDREGFWAEQARLIDWQRPFERVCNHDHPPFARCFEGGLTNLCHNAGKPPPADADQSKRAD